MTLCVLGLGLSFLVIEYNTRRVSEGMVDFGVRYAVEDGYPQVRVAGGRWPPVVNNRLVQAVLSPPLRVLMALWQAQNDALAYLLEFI